MITGINTKSATNAIKMVMPVKKPKLTKWSKVAAMRIKKPVPKTKEVINRALPVPNKVSRIA